jgi:hypothetical protein
MIGSVTDREPRRAARATALARPGFARPSPMLRKGHDNGTELTPDGGEQLTVDAGSS